MTGGELIASSTVDCVSGVGTRVAAVRTKGALCGSGDMSIMSPPNPGEDDGTGGVVTPSHRIGGVVAPSVAWSLVSTLDALLAPDHVPYLLRLTSGIHLLM